MSEEDVRSPCEILKEPYARVLTPGEDGTYTAEILEFHGCYAEGDTADEAIKNLEDAAASWIEAAIEQGQEIPPPATVHEFSGRINLRLPRSIHKQAARFAARDEISLNQFFTAAIASRVGAEQLGDRLIQRLQSCVPTFNMIHVVQFHYDFMVPAETLGPLLESKSTELSWEHQSLNVDAVKVLTHA